MKSRVIVTKPIDDRFGRRTAIVVFESESPTGVLADDDIKKHWLAFEDDVVGLLHEAEDIPVGASGADVSVNNSGRVAREEGS